MAFKFCPECGFKFDKEYKFCPECGFKLDEKTEKMPEPLFDFSDDTAKYAEEKFAGFDEMLKRQNEPSKETKSEPNSESVENKRKTANDIPKSKEEIKNEARQLKQNYRLSRISVSTLRELIKYADEGDAECQYLVGSYYDNRGSRKDNPDKAFYYYSKAANQGYYKVFNCIGLCYNYGRGVESDYAKAAKWFDKAAEKSVDPSDWVSRGIAYMLGRTEKWSAGHEIHRDEGKIYYWFKKAADKGDVDGMYQLGWCYDHGIGVVVNKQEALKWYKKAAELGNAEAIETLKKFR